MIVDGKAIATAMYGELKNEITHMSVRPHLTVFTCAPNFETQKYLNLKRKRAHEIGIGVSLIEFPQEITTEEVVTSVKHATLQSNGIIVQLPFPQHINIDDVLKAIPKNCDVDGAGYDGTDDVVLPPVVGAIEEIARLHEVFFPTQRVVVVGKGKLVGAPSLIWAQKQGAQVSVVDRSTENTREFIENADILILGAGSPGIIKVDDVKQGVVIFDAGTSEDGGILKGDADPQCALKASLMTPVPGGIGPITIAVLLRNLVRLASRG